MNNNIKMWFGGNIYFHDHCAYLDKTELEVTKEHAPSYNIKKWLESKGYSVDYDNCFFMNKGETTWIEYSDGMRVAVSTGYKNQVYIVAVIDITPVNSFEWFDGVIRFERFYRQLKEYVISLVHELEEIDE